MTEKQYSKKKLFETITCQIPRTTVNSVQEVKVNADFISERFKTVLYLLIQRIKGVFLLIKQTITSNKKHQTSLFLLTHSCTNNILVPIFKNHKIKLPYYSNKENASLLADILFFNFLIIQQREHKSLMLPLNLNL